MEKNNTTIVIPDRYWPRVSEILTKSEMVTKIKTRSYYERRLQPFMNKYFFYSFTLIGMFFLFLKANTLIAFPVTVFLSFTIAKFFNLIIGYEFPCEATAKAVGYKGPDDELIPFDKEMMLSILSFNNINNVQKTETFQDVYMLIIYGEKFLEPQLKIV